MGAVLQVVIFVPVSISSRISFRLPCMMRCKISLFEMGRILKYDL